MNCPLPRLGVCLLGALFIPAILAAQIVPAAPTKPEPANEKTVVLDPFEVRTTYNTTTTFDIEEVSTIRGSQGLLYGPSGAAGMVNLTTKLARFNRTSGEIQERIDQFGSKRTMVDAGIGKQNFAFRFAAVDDE